MEKQRKRRLRKLGGTCPMCMGEVGPSGRCTRCAAYVGGRGWEVHVEGTDAIEVQRVAEKLSGQAGIQASRSTRSPWVAGSFYLATAVVMIALLLTAARMVHPLVIPLVIVGSVVFVSVVGAFQLRQDDRLAEKNFLQLMAVALAQLRFVGRRAEPGAQTSQHGGNPQSAAEQGDAADGEERRR